MSPPRLAMVSETNIVSMGKNCKGNKEITETGRKGFGKNNTPGSGSPGVGEGTDRSSAGARFRSPGRVEKTRAPKAKAKAKAKAKGKGKAKGRDRAKTDLDHNIIKYDGHGAAALMYEDDDSPIRKDGHGLLLEKKTVESLSPLRTPPPPPPLLPELQSPNQGPPKSPMWGSNNVGGTNEKCANNLALQNRIQGLQMLHDQLQNELNRKKLLLQRGVEHQTQNPSQNPTLLPYINPNFNLTGACSGGQEQAPHQSNDGQGLIGAAPPACNIDPFQLNLHLPAGGGSVPACNIGTAGMLTMLPMTGMGGGLAAPGNTNNSGTSAPPLHGSEMTPAPTSTPFDMKNTNLPTSSAATAPLPLGAPGADAGIIAMSEEICRTMNPHQLNLLKFCLNQNQLQQKKETPSDEPDDDQEGAITSATKSSNSMPRTGDGKYGFPTSSCSTMARTSVSASGVMNRTSVTSLGPNEEHLQVNTHPLGLLSQLNFAQPMSYDQNHQHIRGGATEATPFMLNMMRMRGAAGASCTTNTQEESQCLHQQQHHQIQIASLLAKTMHPPGDSGSVSGCGLTSLWQQEVFGGGRTGGHYEMQGVEVPCGGGRSPQSYNYSYCWAGSEEQRASAELCSAPARLPGQSSRPSTNHPKNTCGPGD
eukprot:g1613.t1